MMLKYFSMFHMILLRMLAEDKSFLQIQLQVSHLWESKILNTRYENMPKLTDINSLLQLISTFEI